jgi:hypothetical protein
MQDEHRNHQNLATRVWDLVLERSDKMSPLVVSLSLTVDLIEGFTPRKFKFKVKLKILYKSLTKSNVYCIYSAMHLFLY